MLPTAGLLALLLLPCLLLAGAGSASAQPYDIQLTNIQPVDAPSFEGFPYDPTGANATVWLEPLQYSSLTIFDYRTNLDFEVLNNETEWLRLDELEVDHVGGSLPALLLQEDDLFAYDSSLFTFGPTNPLKKRSALVSGGFGTSGLLLQRRFDEEEYLPFGRALGVVAYQPPGANSAYAVVGHRQYYVGDPPETPDDFFELGHHGLLGRFDANGKLTAYSFFPANSLAEIEELGDGWFLVAGDWEIPGPGGALEDVAMLSRVRLYEIDAEGAAENIHQITVDPSFGDGGFAQVKFLEEGETCSILQIVGLTSLSTLQGPRHAVAASLQCDGKLRAGVAVFIGEGKLDEDFGDEGTLVLTGPEDSEVRAVGLERRRGGAVDMMAWLAARTGESCNSNASSGCQFGVTRLTFEGQDEDLGWAQAAFPESQTSVPLDLVVNGQNQPLLGGYGVTGATKFAGMMRFRESGVLDPTFGSAPAEGMSGGLLGGREGQIHGLALAANGDILAATATQHAGSTGTTLAFGVGRFASNGVELWHYDSVDQGSQWQHRIPGEKLDYGAFYEADLQGVAEAVAEDDQGRILAVGGVTSELLVESQWAGPVSTAVARLLPFGVPESRRWVGPGKKLFFRVPEDRTFVQTAPSQVAIRLDFLGGSAVDLQIIRDVAPLFSNAVTSAPSLGGYVFPLAGSNLDFDEAYTIATHTLHNHHRHSSSSRFAYDIGMARWDGSQWNGFRPDVPDHSLNESYLVWNLPVRAAADGEVVACRRSASDNEPGNNAGGPTNFVKIQHAFDAMDKSQREYVIYVHLRNESIPLGVCPLICPEADPGCDVAVDGEDPDGRELPVPIPVTLGQMVGRVGNSGVTSAPHLHIGLTTGAGGDSGDPVAGAIPMLFQDVWLGSRFDAGGDEIDPVEWYPIHNLAIPQDYLVRPGS